MTPQERIQQLAAQRGGVATFPRVSCARQEAEPPRNAAPELTRRLPMPWKGHDSYGKAGLLSDATLHVAAWLICRALGPEWRKVVTHSRGCELTHTSGFRIFMGKCWQNADRYRFSPKDCKERRNDPVPDEITVAANRTPASIASDIQNRILAKGAIEGHAAYREREKARRAKDVADRLAMLGIARALGQNQLREERCWTRSGYPETNEVNLGRTSIRAEQCYSDRFYLHVETADVETAKRIAAAIRAVS